MSDDFHFSHKNESGHDVNAYGYDKNGVYRGTAPFKSSDDNQTSNKEGGASQATGGGSSIGCLLLLIIIGQAIKFLQKNWVSVVAVFGTVILCIISRRIIKRKLTKPNLAIFLAVIISICIIAGIIYLGPVQNDGNFERWRNIKTIHSE